MKKLLIEHECKNGHRYFSKLGYKCPDCGKPLNRPTGLRSILPVEDYTPGPTAGHLRAWSIVLNAYQDIEDVLHEPRLNRAKIQRANNIIGEIVAKQLPG